MSFLNAWLQGIVVAVIITTIIELILPEGNNKKYIKVVLGVYVVFNIIAPIINKFSNSSLEMSSLINIDKYTKEIETYNANFSNIDINETNDESIKQIYISNLKNDIKAKLEEKKYVAKNIDIIISNTENYDIEKIEIYLENEEKTKAGKENKIDQSQIKINEIEKVNIEIASKSTKSDKENEQEQLQESSNKRNKNEKEIKQYLSNVYDINEDKIQVY